MVSTPYAESAANYSPTNQNVKDSANNALTFGDGAKLAQECQPTK
jgi:hypothetical protein